MGATLSRYIGKHSTGDLGDGYRGSGDWIKFWAVLAPNRLRTTSFRFFDSEEAAFRGEKEFLTAEILNDPLCRNLNEGGDGRTSEGMRRTLARPEIKARHRAGVVARWDRPEERARAAEAARNAFCDPHIKAKYYAASKRRWDNPEFRDKHAAGQQARWGTANEREKQRARLLAYGAANPDARARNSRQKAEQWADPVLREKFLAAQKAGKAKMNAGPRAKPVETPEGVFPSLTAAAKHYGIQRKRGERRVRKGLWRYVLVDYLAAPSLLPRSATNTTDD